ncbi:amyloid-beta A4 precursor protein-binding family A member 1-like isoform X2 [Dysidea avara]|uniref:amyloid-beta A4 precursor protein-binding family A member 1-like isoform X2 n=1 Tax=Dysidea avara TaxID=196820 RepID=UPI00332BA0F4
MTDYHKRSAEQEVLKSTAGRGHTHGVHNLEDEDSCSDYMSAESDKDESDQQLSLSNARSSKNTNNSSNISPSRSSARHKPLPDRLTLTSDEELEIPTNISDRYTVPVHPGLPVIPSVPPSPQEKAQVAAKEGRLPCTVNIGIATPPHKPSDLIRGVLYHAQYLGSTFIFVADSCSSVVWTQHAHKVISLVKQPADERQPQFAVSLKISSEYLTMINDQSNVELMSFHLCSVAFVTDVNDLLVIMVRRDGSTPGVAREHNEQPSLKNKISCHVLQASNARIMALAIGQAFNVAYHEFLKSSGIKEDLLQEVEYASILSAQQSPSTEVDPVLHGKTKQVTIGKKRGEMLGIMIVAAGIGSIVPTAVVAHLSKTGPVHKSGQVNVGDYLLSVNGNSLVGLSIPQCIQQLKDARVDQLAKLVILPVPPVLEVSIFRPDTKFPLGFSVKEGVVCNLIRSSMADRSGVRVGYRIIQIGTNNTIKKSHDYIVHLLHTAVGQINIKMMHLLIYKVMTGEMAPIHF